MLLIFFATAAICVGLLAVFSKIFPAANASDFPRLEICMIGTLAGLLLFFLVIAEPASAWLQERQDERNAVAKSVGKSLARGALNPYQSGTSEYKMCEKGRAETKHRMSREDLLREESRITKIPIELLRQTDAEVCRLRNITPASTHDR